MLWAGGERPARKLCSIQNDRAQCYGEDLGFVASLYEDSGGDLWVGMTTGLWRWKPGPPKLYPMPDPGVIHSQGLIEDDNGALLIALQSGIRQLVNGKAVTYRLPVAGPQFKPVALLRDRNGGLWI